MTTLPPIEPTRATRRRTLVLSRLRRVTAWFPFVVLASDAGSMTHVRFLDAGASLSEPASLVLFGVGLLVLRSRIRPRDGSHAAAARPAWCRME